MHQNYIKYNAETPQKYPQSFTGKERDSETGYSYFGARYYDSDILTSWLSVDPLADKYPSLSPYNYCALNPIRVIDPNGDSCAVLLVDDRFPYVGHMAILVQGEGDDNNWYLYSRDGEGKSVLGTPNQVEVGPYESVQKFIDTYKLDDTDKNPYYTEAYVLPTSPAQDKIIRETMTKELKEEYNLLLNNCAQAVNNSLIAAGVNTDGNPFPTGIPLHTTLPFTHLLKNIEDNIMPFPMYRNIMYSNPNGRIVKRTGKK